MPAGRLLGRTRDPEGLLSDLPSVATTLLGLLTGLWLRTSRTLPQKVVGMLASGALMLVLALVWNRWFPINKNLWTSSYVLYAAGWTLLSLAFCIWAIEIKEWKRGWTTLWLVFGGNAITAYVFSELLTSTLYAIPVHAAKGQTTLQQFLYTNIFAPIGNPGFASLLYSICFLIVCAIPIGALYRRQIYIKI
jgi:predicted acyltransferase